MRVFLPWAQNSKADVAVHLAVRAGLGIGMLQYSAARQIPTLHRVLPDLDLPQLDYWIVMHENLRNTAGMVAVFEHLAAHVAVHLGQDNPMAAAA